MPFRSGRVAFCRFRVVGDAPPAPTQDLLDALSEHAFRETPIGAPDEVESGFTTGEHLLDTSFDHNKNVFGPRLLFALRLDTHQPPAELKRAYRQIHEQAAAADNPSGFATRAQKRDAADEADRLLHEDLAAGKFRKSKTISLLWDLQTRTLYCAAPTNKVLEQLTRLFKLAFECDLVYLSAGVRAGEHLKATGRDRDYEDILPSALTPAPQELDDGDLATRPPVPWVAKSVDLKDFIGNEWLLWLWYTLDTTTSGSIRTEHGSVFLALEKSLQMDCAWDLRGKQTLTTEPGTGPHRLPEAREALSHGKWPRKVSLILSDGEEAFELTLQADKLVVSAAKLPEPEETPDHPRELVELRLNTLARLSELLDGLYAAFLSERTGSGWDARRQTIRRWAATTEPQAVAEPAPV